MGIGVSDPEETATVGPEPPPRRGRGTWPPGQVIADRYEIREYLGRGGFATVYRAYDRLVKIEVALKVVHPERDPERALVRLGREVEIARQSRDPHLVRVFDLGKTSEDIFLTMEFLPGGSLRERLARGPLPVPEALRVAEALLQGLAELHAKGAVHRDVTPGNILFGEKDEVKLADFGLARYLAQEEKFTSLGAVLGTAGYRSPEQALGRDLGPRSDLYALGVVLFEMLAGHLPHEATSEFGRHLSVLERAPEVRSYRRDVPPWTAKIVARLLEVRLSERYRTAEEVLGDLRRGRSPRRVRLWRRLFRLTAVLLLCLPPAGVLVTLPRHAAFSHLVPAGETGVKAVSEAGETLWTIPGVNPEIADRGAMARITPGGSRLLAIVLSRPGDWSMAAVSTLSFLDPDSGRVVKEVKLPNGADAFPNDPPRFFASSVKALDLFHDGVDEVIVNCSHVPEAPFYAVLYAPRYDQARIVFYSRGGQDFQGAADLDGDGVKELLFAGINNGWNWVNIVAAVRLDPRSLLQGDRATTPAAPDARTQLAQGRFLLWYAIIPRGDLEGFSRITIDEKRRELTIHYLSGKTWVLGFDGFPPDAAHSDNSLRQADRREVYDHLWEAERLRRAGMLDLAMAEADAALASAKRARETWLGQYAERVEAKILAAQGKTKEAETRFASLFERAEDAPELAYDAAVAFHLTGDLSRAVAWYERGIGRESAIGAGKSKHEFLKGEVLALVEQKRYEEALAAVARFGATYPAFGSQLWIYREYIRWRSGERPVADPSGVSSNGTDLYRYWALEFAFAEGAEPQVLLKRVDSFLAERPETRAEALSLKAELLSRLGRGPEAAETAQSALELVRVERPRSIIADGHADLLTERAHRLQREAKALTSTGRSVGP
jgi:tRNA A-37 threonylcarbamoyl transferase component Bud32/tetratricopeptide (TPR) repeat protein